MEEILQNAQEFLDSGNDNLEKNRFNAAVSDFFKAIVTLADFQLYKQIKILPKNHNERFDLLGKYFPEINEKIKDLFQKYRESYNLRLTKQDAQNIKEYADELKNNITN